jgi:hypothetical protein
MGTLCAGPAEIALARKQPILIGAEKLPVSFLKHSDEQTVAGLKAVLAALEGAGWQGKSFADWGVIAAAGLFGRYGIFQTMRRYRQEGAWGVSPNVIPHQSLHGMSGTISQALKIHGPNFGIGAGFNPLSEAFLLAAAMMMDGSLPGLWLVLTGHETEWVPAADGQDPPTPACQAVAIALTQVETDADGPLLSIDQATAAAVEDLSLTCPEIQMGLLAQEVETRRPAGKWRLADSHWVQIETHLQELEVLS